MELNTVNQSDGELNIDRGYLIFFSVRSNFISPNEHQKQYFQVLVFMSEIKFDLTLKKSNFLFLLCSYLQ